MSSEIYEKDSAMFSLLPAWHGLGMTFDKVMTAEEARYGDGKDNRLDWTVDSRQAGYLNDDGVFVPWKGRVCNLRSDIASTDPRGQLGMVSDLFVTVQQVEAFTFLDSLVMDGIMKYESAFSMRNGKRVCILGRMPEVDEIAEGDELARFILWANNHDGTTAAQAFPTGYRVVCANTRALAYGRADRDGPDKRITISHSGDMTAKLDAAREMIRNAGRHFDRATEDARLLANKTITDAQFTQYLDRMVPLPENYGSVVQAERTRLRRKRDTITGNYLSGREQQLPSIRRTAWAAYNAVSQYVDHDMKRNTPENRASSVLWGDGAGIKDNAHRVALELAASN